MKRLFVVLILMTIANSAFASCEDYSPIITKLIGLNLPGSTESTLYHPNGSIAESGDIWYYSNGAVACSRDTIYFSTGSIAQTGGTWYHKSGGFAKYAGTWHFSNGAVACSGGIAYDVKGNIAENGVNCDDDEAMAAYVGLY